MPVEIVSDPMLSMSGDPRHRRWLVLVVLAIISLVLLWRRPDIATNPQFWAEDGVVFFAEAHD